MIGALPFIVFSSKPVPDDGAMNLSFDCRRKIPKLRQKKQKHVSNCPASSAAHYRSDFPLEMNVTRTHHRCSICGFLSASLYFFAHSRHYNSDSTKNHNTKTFSFTLSLHHILPSSSSAWTATFARKRARPTLAQCWLARLARRAA